MKASDVPVLNMVASALVAASNGEERGITALLWWMTYTKEIEETDAAR